MKLYYLSAPTPAPPRIGWRGPMRATTSSRSTAVNACNLVPVACTSCGRSPTATAHVLRTAQFWHLIGSRISYLISSRLGIYLRQSSLTCLGRHLRGAAISICRLGTGTRRGLRRTFYWQMSLLRLGLRWSTPWPTKGPGAALIDEQRSPPSARRWTAPSDAPATSSLPGALVELLPTAARRALGSAPHASVRHALYGLVDD